MKNTTQYKGDGRNMQTIKSGQNHANRRKISSKLGKKINGKFGNIIPDFPYYS